MIKILQSEYNLENPQKQSIVETTRRNIVETTHRVVSTTTDTTEYEHQIDQLVYKLYDLTEDEIKIVESEPNTRDMVI